MENGIIHTTKEEGKVDEVVFVRQCAAERGALRAVRALQGLSRPAGLHRCRRPRRILRWHPLVGAHGSQFPRLGWSLHAFRIPLPPQGAEVGMRSDL